MLELNWIMEDGTEFIEYVDASFLTIEGLSLETQDEWDFGFGDVEILSYRPEFA